ncbi:MAG TPA: alpha/beta fold hydrolase [Chloroflexaceae bacterium]|nr:alpha/beta fold hydrolase [Chloroflexaceae bacterium]
MTTQSDPFLFAGGDHGCLLIHGFGGSPDEMRGLGEQLAARGLTVLGLRLPGHGGPPDQLAAVRWRDWLAAVADAHAYLDGRCARVSVAGFSLGGALAILLAARAPVQRLALLATPTRLQGGWRLHLLAVARHTTPWFYPLERADFRDPAVRAQVARHAPEADLDDPAVQARVRREARISLHAVDELRLALAAARAALPRARAPALVMHGRLDDVAPLDSATTIAGGLGGPRPELVWWDDTGHQLLVEGPHREAIIERAGAFIAG